MSHKTANTEKMVEKCEVVVDATNNVQTNQNDSLNTLKSVRKKIRSFRRKFNETDSSDQKDMNCEKSSDESLGKSKITLRKIFRKSSFKKFIQHFTNFTVSDLQLQNSFIIRTKKKS